MCQNQSKRHTVFKYVLSIQEQGKFKKKKKVSTICEEETGSNTCIQETF